MAAGNFKVLGKRGLLRHLGQCRRQFLLLVRRGRAHVNYIYFYGRLLRACSRLLRIRDLSQGNDRCKSDRSEDEKFLREHGKIVSGSIRLHGARLSASDAETSITQPTAITKLFSTVTRRPYGWSKLAALSRPLQIQLRSRHAGAATAADFARTPIAATPYRNPPHVLSASSHPARAKEIQ